MLQTADFQDMKSPGDSEVMKGNLYNSERTGVRFRAVDPDRWRFSGFRFEVRIDSTRLHFYWCWTAPLVLVWQRRKILRLCQTALRKHE